MTVGITRMVGLAASLVFAVPLALFALRQLADGRVAIGGALLGVAALMVLVPQYVTTPMDLPERVLTGVLGRVVGTGDEPTDEERPGE